MIELRMIVRKSFSDLINRTKYQLFPLPQKLDGDAENLQQTIAWLVRAVRYGRGGVSSHYSLLHGRWLAPFPETTGYIIPTFFDFAAFSGDESYRHLAIRLTDWLGSVQLDDGACMGGVYRPGKPAKPIIFNTGQNIFGFLRSHVETGETKYLTHARRAGDFLTRNVDANGIWNRALHHGIRHTYNSRTAWALLELHALTGHEPFRQIARSNLDWVLEQQTPNGWFRQANFKPRELPNTHGLAYTVRGLLESGALCGDERYVTAARRTADRFARLFEIRSHLFAFWDERFRNHGKYFRRTTGRHICLTGCAQLALIWMRLHELTGDATYSSTAFKMIDFLKALQDVRSSHEGIRGGIPGAFPIWGSYASLKYPNWAAKFFADAIMKKIALTQREQLGRPRTPAAMAAR